MNNYLLQLLKEVKTIIIPGLGALTLTNEVSGEMMFMPYLKYDDGNLAKHISEKEGMDMNDAKNLIAKFVREVTAELDKGNSYDMYQFGSFKKIDGDVAFEQWNSTTPADETTNVVVEVVEPVVATSTPEIPEPVILEEPVHVEAEVVIEPELVEEPVVEPEQPEEELPLATNTVAETIVETAIIADVVADLPETTEEEPIVAEPEVEEEVVAVVADPIVPTEVAEPVIEVTPPIQEPTIVAPTPDKQVDLSKKPAAKKPTEKQPEQPKKKRRVLAYILWGFLVLFMGGATYVAINFNSLKKDFPILADLAGENNDKALKKSDLAKEKEVEAEETNQEAEESANVEEEPVVEPEPTPEPEPLVVEQPEPVKTTSTVKKPRPKQSSGSSSIVIGKPDPSKPYHVIGGSFGSEANAKRFARDLIGKGQPSVMVGEFNGMYRVSIASFSTNEEALQANSSLKEIAPQSWVFKWP